MKNSKIITVSSDIDGSKLTLETGKLANLTNASVVATLGDTSILATIVAKPTAEVSDFFPLRVDYEERFYAGGRIGGSRFMRREGRPNDEAVISGRLIDHAMRPLFKKDFMDETQIIVTVLSLDEENDPAALGFYATSVALMISGLPFNGPIVSMNIDRKDGNVNAGFKRKEKGSDMHLAVSYLENGTKIQAIEAEAEIVAEGDVLEAIKLGGEKSKAYFDLANEFVSKVEVEKYEYTPYWLTKDILDEFSKVAMPEIESWEANGLFYTDKEWEQNQSKLIDKLAEENEKYSKDQFKVIVADIQKNWVRKTVIEKGKRIDGRGFDEIRKLSGEISLVPRVHGSGLFNRGKTQCLTIATLGPLADKLLTNQMDGEEEKRYLHHYNFPPFSVGEIGRVGGANRRAIGHGILAEKALSAVLPSEEEFPYVIRNVSEVLSSNGSTSMAATCGSSLALMDAGVPIKAQVGGIGVGLFFDKTKENLSLEDYILLTDIVGYEDFSGYMDFKMTGTRKGMTAIQLELKASGLPFELIEKMFETSRVARMQVLDVMDAIIDAPKKNISEYAPKIDFVKIKKDDIGKVIGSGGSTIKDIMEKSGAQVDIEEKDEYGLVCISSTSLENIAIAKKYVEDMLAEVEEGAVYEGPITKIADFGAFVEILPKQEGLLHVSEWSYDYVNDISKVAKVGDIVRVKVLRVENGKFALSKKALEEKPEGYVEPEKKERKFDNNRRNNGFNRRDNRSSYNRR